MSSPQVIRDDLEHFVLHVHGACLHVYRSEDLTNVLLNGQYSGQDLEGRLVLLLIHPRWCPECVQERKGAISICYDQRLRDLEEARGHEEVLQVEAAYLQGLRDGRIAFITTSFADMPGWETPETVLVDDGVVDMFGVMEVGTRSKGPEEISEELAEVLRRQNLGGDTLEEALEQGFKVQEVYQLGFKHGRDKQFTIEWEAMFELDIDARKQMFIMALT